VMAVKYVTTRATPRCLPVNGTLIGF